ncbi:hypothetical protein [Nocardia barduliensis]|nr:hypothetical protein [Nocardia barduliensis]
MTLCSDYRFASVAGLGCTVLDTRAFVDGGAAEDDFATFVAGSND